MKVTKFETGKYSYWRFSFNDATKKPKKKFFTFSCDKFTKKEVELLAFDYLKAKQNGWDPWSKEIPNNFLKGEYQNGDKIHVLLDVIIEEYMTRNNNLNDSTRNYYRSHYRTLSEALGNPFIHTITEEQVNDWVNDTKSFNTRRSRKSLFRLLWAHAVRQNLVKPITPLAQGTRQEKANKRKSYITHEQFSHLLDTVNKDIIDIKENNLFRMSIDKREQVKDIMTILFYQGFRINELVELKTAWFTLDHKFIAIGDKEEWGLENPFIPKSGKIDSAIPVPQELEEVYAKYLDKKNPFAPLFPIRSQALARMIKHYLSEAFPYIKNKLSTHSLRDSCATYWINERNIPVFHVQKLLRHSDIATTMRYVHYSPEATYLAFNKSENVANSDKSRKNV